MQILLQDIRHALRMFRENPGFIATALAALALGIGSNTAIFSVVNAVVLKPVRFSEPDRLVRLMNTQKGNPAGAAASPAKFMHWRAQTEVPEDVVAYRNSALNFDNGDVPERITAAQASEAYFRTFRAPIEQGRTFTEEEDLPGGENVVVLGHGFWTNRLAGDPNISGKNITLNW